MIAALLALALAAPPEDSGIGLSLAEVATMVARHVPDKIVAATLERGEVRRCLSRVDLAWLESKGMGPKGVEAARKHLCDCSTPPARSDEPEEPVSRRERRKKRRAECRRLP